MAAYSTQIESLLNFLIESHIVDNSQDSETLSKFLNLYDQFEEQQDCNVEDSSHNDDDSQIMFETRAIFTLADFLKALSANEYYDIAQKLFNQWSEKESKKHFVILEKVVKIKDKLERSELQNAFQKWKLANNFANLLEENEKLREYIHILSKENENLSQERNILELQTKKRNQISINNIKPLRQTRVSSLSFQSNSRHNNQLTQTFKGSSIDSEPIHDRLHREAYKKNQQQVVYDIIKQKEELRDCTFKPNSSMQQINSDQVITTPMSQSSRRYQQQREDPFLYERLSKSIKKFNPELMQLQKENEEMRDCTFKPETNSKSKQLVEKMQNDYENKDQFYDRLYKEGENKNKYMKNLQILKDKAEINSCTFQPETNRYKNSSILNSVRKEKDQTYSSFSEDPFTRLHQEHESKQRNLVKKECEYDQKFKEQHPFQPTRVTKQKDQELNGCKKETSQQRAARMYENWKEKERKIQEKRDELLKEEEKLCKLTLVTQQKKVKQASANQSISYASSSPHQLSTIGSNHSSVPSNRHDQLYFMGKDKNRKQEEMREKIFKEQGLTFAPQTNQNQKYKVDKNVIDRNQEFIQRRESHIKEIQEQTSYDFKPQRVTTKSKLAKNYERENENQENLGQKLYEKGAQIEQKKEQQRLQYSVDKNCTFKPQLAKKTEKILRESSTQRNCHISSYTKSASSVTSFNYNNADNKQPFTNRANM